jgi:hypothetical protein
MRAIALAFQCTRGEAAVRASQAYAGAPRRPAATPFIWWRSREPSGGLRCRFGSEVSA